MRMVRRRTFLVLHVPWAYRVNVQRVHGESFFFSRLHRFRLPRRRLTHLRESTYFPRRNSVILPFQRRVHWDRPSERGTRRGRRKTSLRLRRVDQTMRNHPHRDVHRGPARGVATMQWFHVIPFQQHRRTLTHRREQNDLGVVRSVVHLTMLGVSSLGARRPMATRLSRRGVSPFVRRRIRVSK